MDYLPYMFACSGLTIKVRYTGREATKFDIIDSLQKVATGRKLRTQFLNFT